MPAGQYIRTKEYRENMRKLYLGTSRSEITKIKTKENHKGMSGRHHSEETKNKISEAQKGSKNHNFGKHHSEEGKKKISEAQKGIIKSEKTKKKMSEAKTGTKNPNFGKHPSKETRNKMLEVWNKRSLSMKGKTGINHSAWKGERCITPVKQRIIKGLKYAQWRRGSLFVIISLVKNAKYEVPDYKHII